ncbi:MAG: archaellin/type IV pilin N-terminal domain-containing protein [Nitrososphaerota archaeon]|nr:archaellin/type IV pilin N-terminal domain-containing protein [Nitrososphaerota archaeon]
MKILKSRKALSPVVATIILIAVTVAVSIAVAAWMGALTFTFTATEQLQITRIQFVTETGGNPTTEILVTVLNTGTNPVTLTDVQVTNSATPEIAAAEKPDGTPITVDEGTVTIPGNTRAILTIELNKAWVRGANYEVKLLSSRGNTFMRTETAPTS